jgi:molybdenum cofactor biosynthesis enzyme MoaA
LFNKIIKIIPQLNTKININTIILPETKEEEVIKLNDIFNKINIHIHRISYYMNFNQIDIDNSLNKISSLKITTKFKENIDNIKLKIKTIKIYKTLIYIKNKKEMKTNLDFHPISILK